MFGTHWKLSRRKIRHGCATSRRWLFSITSLKCEQHHILGCATSSCSSTASVSSETYVESSIGAYGSLQDSWREGYSHGCITSTGMTLGVEAYSANQKSPRRLAFYGSVLFPLHSLVQHCLDAFHGLEFRYDYGHFIHDTQGQPVRRIECRGQRKLYNSFCEVRFGTDWRIQHALFLSIGSWGILVGMIC